VSARNGESLLCQHHVREDRACSDGVPMWRKEQPWERAVA